MRARLAPIVAVAVAVAVAALGAIGCGEERGDATRTVPERAGPPEAIDKRAVAIVDVSLVEYELKTSNGIARVPRAGLIAFQATNDGLVRHALAVDGPAGQARTPSLRPGDRATISVRLPPGTYKWYCPLADHERRGMAGRLRVAE